jgi:hypothetical protein
MINLIEHNAGELRELHAAIHRAFRSRDASKAGFAAWRQACEAFHSNYDRLAFPGGLNRAYDHLKQGDAEVTEPVIAFLEADPYFFRSGYVKADLLRALPKFPLDQRQRARLRQVILARVKGPARREFRRYCNLAPHVTTPGFEEELATLAAGSQQQLTARHAGWVLAALRRGVQKRSRGAA